VGSEFQPLILSPQCRQLIIPTSRTSRRRSKRGSKSCRGIITAMQHIMDGGGMMWGMGLSGLIVLVLIVLAIAALVKYVFFR
jgi:hypothetical protein